MLTTKVKSCIPDDNVRLLLLRMILRSNHIPGNICNDDSSIVITAVYCIIIFIFKRLTSYKIFCIVFLPLTRFSYSFAQDRRYFCKIFICIFPTFLSYWIYTVILINVFFALLTSRDLIIFCVFLFVFSTGPGAEEDTTDRTQTQG
jgi:hypothetical protein